MLVDDDVRQLILKNVDSGTIKKAAVERGMLTLLEHGAYKVARGITTAAEVLSRHRRGHPLAHARLRVQGAHQRREDRRRG